MLGVGPPYVRVELLLDATGVAEDRLRRVLVALRGVLDQVASASSKPSPRRRLLLDRAALLTPPALEL